MSALTDHAVRVRPRARGWIHLYSAAGALVMGIVLVVLAGTRVNAPTAVACAVYAVTLVGLFGISSTYHLHTWISARARTWMKRADHSMIFVFIAGTYTPIAMMALEDPNRTVVLVVVWAGAAGGVALKMVRPNAPRWIGVPFYMALGWVAVFIMPDMVTNGGVAVVVLVCVGGLFYTVGAVFYAIRKPNPWPETFGYHECFHAMVTAAAICHAVAIWLLVYSSSA